MLLFHWWLVWLLPISLFFSGFAGQVFLGNYVVLNYVNNLPSVTLFCIFENSGAKLGILDDLRVIVEHHQTGVTYKFFPILLRDDFNIFKQYSNDDWSAFSGVVLSPNSRIQKFVVFRAVSDSFRIQKGQFKITVQSRWYGRNRWQDLPYPLQFSLTEDDAQQWNDPQKGQLQVASEAILGLR